MNEKRIKYFIEAARTLNLHKASLNLGISSAALSKQIASLEDEWGISLFDRTNKGLVLTPAGTAMYRDIWRIKNYYLKALNNARLENDKQERHIRIGISSLGGGKLLLDVFEKLQYRDNSFTYEFVNFNMSKEEVEKIVKTLGKKIDILFSVYDDSIINKDFCKAVKVTHERLALAVPRKHPLSNKDCITLKDLQKEKCVLLHNAKDKDNHLIKAKLSKYGIETESLVNYNEDTFSECEKNNKILFVLNFWKPLNPLIKIMPLEWDCVVPICMYYSKLANTDTLEFVKRVKTLL
ncbi:MAG: LysR family transcriptional regulator [Lachnospiraceae bacterium]|nr:LysR family transcriptional regulator [Lachnospiraceae bacterium]